MAAGRLGMSPAQPISQLDPILHLICNGLASDTAGYRSFCDGKQNNFKIMGAPPAERPHHRISPYVLAVHRLAMEIDV